MAQDVGQIRWKNAPEYSERVQGRENVDGGFRRDGVRY
jgi:hypothetical protein